LAKYILKLQVAHSLLVKQWSIYGHKDDLRLEDQGQWETTYGEISTLGGNFSLISEMHWRILLNLS